MPVGRPRAFDIDKALGRALEVFWRKGYEGASLSDLTAAMGVNRPSLYAAFGNKEALFRKALDRYVAGPAGSRPGRRRERPPSRPGQRKVLATRNPVKPRPASGGVRARYANRANAARPGRGKSRRAGRCFFPAAVAGAGTSGFPASRR